MPHSDMPSTPDPGGSLTPDEIKADGPGTGESATPVFIEPNTNPNPTVTFVDMDGDGDSDILIQSHDGSKSSWIANNLGKEAEEIFKHSIFKSITPTAIAAGDVDGDGTQDIVVGHMSGAKIFHNDGNWTMENLGVALDNPNTIILDDINKDGLTDILIRDSRELVLIQNSDAQLGTQSMAWPHLGKSSLLAVGDFNLTNSTLEILTLNQDGILHMVSHSGQHWQAVQAISSISMISFSIKDLNLDGLNDVYVEDGEGNKVWLEGDGTGGLIFHATEDPPVTVLNNDFIEPAAGEEKTPVYSDKDTYNSANSELSPSPSPAIMDAPASNKASMHAPELEMMAAKSIGFSPAPFFAMMAMPTFFSPELLPESTEPTFDFQALPDLSFELSADTTVDYSDKSSGREIDLDNGEASSMPSFGWFGSWWGSWFNHWFNWGSNDNWDNTDEIVNAIGTHSDDDIYGNEHDNILFGQGGDDYLFGEGGNDTLVGGQGEDIIYGGDGDDLMSGQQGSDIMFGNAGDDLIYGGKGEDIIFGNKGDDTILGGQGDDMLFGDKGNDVIHGGKGADIMYGDDGNDTFHYVSAEEGGDSVYNFSVGHDTFEFEFGSHNLLTVSEPYTGDGGDVGETFVWEDTGHGSGNLYYDADGSVAGNETLIAKVELLDDDTTFTVDDISIV